MAEDQTTGQEPTEGQTAPAADGAAGVKETPQVQNAEELRALLEKERTDRQEANREAHKLRARLRELEKAEEERAKAQMTEQERVAAELEAARKQLAELQEAHRAGVVRNAITLVAAEISIVDPDAGYKLLDHDKLEYDEAGAPTNVRDLLTKLLRAKPYLGRTGNMGVTNALRGEGAQLGREQELRRRLEGRQTGLWDPKQGEEYDRIEAPR